MTARPRSRARWVAAAGLVIYLAAAGVILLAPVSYGGIVHEIAGWIKAMPGVHSFGSGWVEFAANVALFVPMGFLLAVLLRRAWFGALIGAVVSVCVELAQANIPDREPSVRDVISNTIGAIVGALLAWLLVLRRQRTQRRAAQTAR